MYRRPPTPAYLSTKPEPLADIDFQQGSSSSAPGAGSFYCLPTVMSGLGMKAWTDPQDKSIARSETRVLYRSGIEPPAEIPVPDVDDFNGKKRKSSILSLGEGRGQFLKRAMERDYAFTGVDLDYPTGADTGYLKEETKIFCTDATSLPLSYGNKFDLVTSHALVTNLSDFRGAKEDLMNEAFRAAKVGGQIRLEVDGYVLDKGEEAEISEPVQAADAMLGKVPPEANEGVQAARAMLAVLPRGAYEAEIRYNLTEENDALVDTHGGECEPLGRTFSVTLVVRKKKEAPAAVRRQSSAPMPCSPKGGGGGGKEKGGPMGNPVAAPDNFHLK